jgi:hypothetical protein
MPRSVSSQEGILVSNNNLSQKQQDHQICTKQYLKTPETKEQDEKKTFSSKQTSQQNNQLQSPTITTTSKRLSIQSASLLLDSVRRKL